MNAIERLRSQAIADAAAVVATLAVTVKTVDCKGKKTREILDLVDAATSDEAMPILDEIYKQIDEYDAQPKEFICGEERPRYPHGFWQWLYSLRDGFGRLPETIPVAILLGWRDGYKHHPCNQRPGNPHRASPQPCRRCMSCQVIFSSPPGSEWAAQWDACPVCKGGRDRIWVTDLSKSYGTFKPV